ncbi:universal stress protein [Nocardia australiensis]|uniref:universal stress protein n=1 Tax=Nocardia australiensis TaxID=2887191 RepID=UPI001D149651|nr:universal stress protein [Nocardia australiensis]
MTVQRPDDPHRSASAPVVVGTDGSEAAGLAVGWAAEVAAQRGRRLIIVHGLDLATARSGFGVVDLIAPAVSDAIKRRGADHVSAAARLAHEVAPGLSIETMVSETGPALLLIEQSASANLVAIGSSGESGTIAHLGSTLLAVVGHGHGAIVVVRDTGTEQQPRHDGPVVVGVDGSAAGAAAVAAAFAEAAERNARLIAVHAYSDLNFDRFAGLPNTIRDPAVAAAAQAVLAEQLAGWQEKYPDVEVVRKVYPSGPRHQLIEWSKSAQILVVGSRGRGGFSGLLLGTTSNSLVQQARCPVMVVHQR